MIMSNNERLNKEIGRLQAENMDFRELLSQIVALRFSPIELVTRLNNIAVAERTAQEKK